MLYRKVSGLDRELSAIAFGGASLSGEGGGYGFGPISEAQAEELIKSAWEAGINVFDTAPIYGFGLSEERLGRYLPKEAFVVTKSGVDWHPSKRVNMTNAASVTRRMLEESLTRLKRESIDLYMIHWPDAKVPIEEPMQIMAQAQKEGLIQFIGLCNTTPEDFDRAQKIARITALQSELNLFFQEPFERLQERWKETYSMGWGTFDKGILSGRVTKDRIFSSQDARSWAPWWNKKEVQRKIERTEKLQAIIQKEDFDLADLCIHHSLFHFGLSSCLIGFKSVGDVVKATTSLHRGDMRERIRNVLKEWDYSS